MIAMNDSTLCGPVPSGAISWVGEYGLDTQISIDSVG
jgi:hypothetical protein